MLRIVLDANVFISAAIRPSGPPGQILAALFGQQAFALVLTPTIVAEVKRAFRSKRLQRFIADPVQAQRFLADAQAVADLVEDTGRVLGACRDPDDDFILAAALEGRAQVIATGDADLLALLEYAGVAIASPRAVVKLLKHTHPV